MRRSSSPGATVALPLDVGTETFPASRESVVAALRDTWHITEGVTSEEDHHRIFAGEAAQAIVAQVDAILAKASEYTAYVPVRGKAAF